MGIIIDLIIIAIMLSFIFTGYKRGLTGSLIKLLSFVIAIVLAFVLYKPVANMIIEKTQIDDNIKTTIINTIVKDDSLENDEEKNIPTTMVENINNEIKNATEQAKMTIIEEATITIINITAGIIVFLVVRIILAIISIFIDQITRLPIIKQADAIGGIIYGIVEGAIVVYIVLSIVSLISVIWIDNFVVMAVTKSTLGNLLYNNNIILNLLFK